MHSLARNECIDQGPNAIIIFSFIGYKSREIVYARAVEIMRGDDINTKVWWEK